MQVRQMQVVILRKMHQDSDLEFISAAIFPNRNMFPLPDLFRSAGL